MFVFVCAECGAGLTAPLSRVVLPVHAHQKYGNAIQLPVLMEPGTFAVEPEPWGPPWRRWEDVDPDEPAARHTRADPRPVRRRAGRGRHRARRRPRHRADPGEVQRLLLRPRRSRRPQPGLRGVRPTRGEQDRRLLALAGGVARPRRRAPPPSRRHRRRTAFLDGAGGAGKGHAPFEPITAWGGPRLGSYHWWSWSPRWEAAAGRALAHLLAASDGRSVTVPDGLTGEVFQRALDILLPAGPPTRRAVLAGPGLPAPDADADILIVPNHPQTGRPGPHPARPPRRPRCPCRSGCGGGWLSPSRTHPPPCRASCPTASYATIRPHHTPAASSGPTRKSSGTPWPGYQPSAAGGYTRS